MFVPRHYLQFKGACGLNSHSWKLKKVIKYMQKNIKIVIIHKIETSSHTLTILNMCSHWIPHLSIYSVQFIYTHVAMIVILRGIDIKLTIDRR